MNLSAIIFEKHVAGMSEAEFHAFPLGIIRLDRSGKVIAYNRAQAEFAHRTAATTVGLNFWRDVAPCAAVKNFQGRFNDFIRTSGSRIEQFKFEFRFDWGIKQVTISMVRRAGADDVYIVIYATPVTA